MTMPTGDFEIKQETILWRRILPNWIHTNSDGSRRPKSMAFVDRRTDELSVHIAALTTPTAALEGRPHDSLVEIPAGLISQLGLQITHAPTENDPSHTLIAPRLTGSKAKKLAENSRWVVLREP